MHLMSFDFVYVYQVRSQFPLIKTNQGYPDAPLTDIFHPDQHPDEFPLVPSSAVTSLWHPELYTMLQL